MDKVREESIKRVNKFDANHSVIYRNGFYCGFSEGVEWLQTLSIFERLTDEEKAEIRKSYNEKITERKKAMKEKDTFYYNILSAQIGMLEEIFDKIN